MSIRLKSIIQKLNLLFFPLRVKKGNDLKNDGFAYNVNLDIEGKNNSIFIAKGASIENVNIYIRGNNNTLIIDENVKVKAGLFWFEDNNGTIQIGKNTTIEKANIATVEDFQYIKVGNDCMLSNGVDIRNSDSHSIVDLASNKRINYGKSITIEDHVWIGANATILKGVTIKQNAVIAMGSIVTNNVEANSVYGGNPARKLKSTINWNRDRIK